MIKHGTAGGSHNVFWLLEAGLAPAGGTLSLMEEQKGCR